MAGRARGVFRQEAAGDQRSPRHEGRARSPSPCSSRSAQPQKLAALPNVPDVQPSEKKPAPAEASATADAPKLQPDMPEGAPLPEVVSPPPKGVQQAEAFSRVLDAVA